jgi:hypothetical protein
MKRLLILTCILFWVVAGKAESIDQRNFALDTFSPTPNDVRVAEKRVQAYWNKHKAQYGANTRYLAVEAGAILSGGDLLVKSNFSDFTARLSVFTISTFVIINSRFG